MFISAPNSACFPLKHETHAMIRPPILLIFRNFDTGNAAVPMCATQMGILCHPRENTFPELFWL